VHCSDPIALHGPKGTYRAVFHTWDFQLDGIFNRWTPRYAYRAFRIGPGPPGAPPGCPGAPPGLLFISFYKDLKPKTDEKR